MINQPTYTQCPNIFFDEILKDLSGSETKVFCVIMRKTFGWQKSKDRISYSQIMEMSGISSKATVSDAIKSLEIKGFVIAEREKQTTVYSVNVSEIEPVQKLNRYENCTSTGTIIEPSLPETGTITVHTKETNLNKLSKETKHKHGEYKHILLSSDEYLKLVEEWGEPELLRMIKNLDEGIETKGYKYKNFNLTLRNWKKNDRGIPIPKPSSSSRTDITRVCPDCKKELDIYNTCPQCGKEYDLLGRPI